MKDLNRRDFLKSVGQYSLAGTAAYYLPAVHADCCRLSWWSMFKLQPARIIAGLVFDEVAPVLVRWAANGVFELFSGSYRSYGSASYGALASETHFNHPA
jgi:hypothetical protein